MKFRAVLLWLMAQLTSRLEDEVARKDIDFNFVPHPLTGDLSTKKDSTAIKQSIRNIVLTSFYERGFNVEFGTNIRSSLFENITLLEAQTIRDLIVEGIRNFEPQVEAFEVNVGFGDTDHDILVTVLYTENNNPDEQSVQVRLEQLR